MRRPTRTKLQILDVRHPGLSQKVHTMFEGFWGTRDIRHLIQAQYGESFGRSTLDNYRRKHWQAQRALVQEMIGSSGHRVV
jgi:hypothetical protein